MFDLIFFSSSGESSLPWASFSCSFALQLCISQSSSLEIILSGYLPDLTPTFAALHLLPQNSGRNVGNCFRIGYSFISGCKVWHSLLAGIRTELALALLIVSFSILDVGATTSTFSPFRSQAYTQDVVNPARIVLATAQDLISMILSATSMSLSSRGRESLILVYLIHLP